MRKKLLKVLSITLVATAILTNSAFAATTENSQADLVSAGVAIVTSDIKSGEGTVADVNTLVELAKGGNIEAEKALLSFDCFNEDMVNEVTANVTVEPNTEKTFLFDDGSSIILKNVTAPANVSLMSIPTTVTLLSRYPTAPQTTYIYESHNLLGVALYTHGGSVTWYDSSINSCRITSTAPYIAGSFITISNPSSSVITSGQQVATFSVSASISYVEYGITLWSKSGTDVMYVETAGCAGFSSKGLCN